MSKRVTIEDDIWCLDEEAISNVYETEEEIPPADTKEPFERGVKEEPAIFAQIREAAAKQKGEVHEEEPEVPEEPEEPAEEPANEPIEEPPAEEPAEKPKKKPAAKPEEPEEPQEKQVLTLVSDEHEITVDYFPFVIGRHDCDYDIDYRFISKPHCRITEEDGRFFIEDLGSTNGTFIGTRELEENVRARIKNGQNVTLADMKFKVRIK